MIQALIRRLSFYKKIRFFPFLYWNYFCKSVIRTDNSKLIPYKHAVIELEKGARIFLGGGDIEVGCDRLKGSKAETRVRLRAGAVWSSYGGCKLSYGTTLELLPNAMLDSRYFTMNSNSVMIAAKRITLGNDVMIARSVVLYDSDFHSIVGEQGEIRNLPEPLVLGDHVWLGTNVTVLKGSRIGNGSIVGAGSIVSGSVPENVIYSTERTERIKENAGGWSRKSPN